MTKMYETMTIADLWKHVNEAYKLDLAEGKNSKVCISYLDDKEGRKVCLIPILEWSKIHSGGYIVEGFDWHENKDNQ